MRKLLVFNKPRKLLVVSIIEEVHVFGKDMLSRKNDLMKVAADIFKAAETAIKKFIWRSCIDDQIKSHFFAFNPNRAFKNVVSFDSSRQKNRGVCRCHIEKSIITIGGSGVCGKCRIPRRSGTTLDGYPFGRPVECVDKPIVRD